jgi:hypothetical protein
VGRDRLRQALDFATFADLVLTVAACGGVPVLGRKWDHHGYWYRDQSPESTNLLDAEDHPDYQGNGDNERDYRPARDRVGSPALYATQRVVPIPFRFVIEAARTIVGHLIAPEKVTPPGAITLARRRQSAHQRSIKQSGVFEPVGLGPHSLFVADLVHGDARVAARLTFGAVRSLGFGGPAA